MTATPHPRQAQPVLRLIGRTAAYPDGVHSRTAISTGAVCALLRTDERQPRTGTPRSLADTFPATDHAGPIPYFRQLPKLKKMRQSSFGPKMLWIFRPGSSLPHEEASGLKANRMWGTRP